jgi:hypothetical protein
MPLNILKISSLVFVFLLLPTICFAAHLHKEKVYQEAWCAKAGGVMEYRLDDGTRVDCLTDEYAIEFDFAPKWAESIGQALYYAERTGRKPGVVLIMEGDGEDRFLKRLNAVADRYQIKVWTTLPADL